LNNPEPARRDSTGGPARETEDSSDQALWSQSGASAERLSALIIADQISEDERRLALLQFVLRSPLAFLSVDLAFVDADSTIK
jgi:hypothetical protein